jgi:hypothetical protein
MNYTEIIGETKSELQELENAQNLFSFRNEDVFCGFSKGAKRRPKNESEK